MKALIPILLVGALATSPNQKKSIPKDFKQLAKEIKKGKTITSDTFLKYTQFTPASGAYSSKRITKYIYLNDSTLGYTVSETDGSYLKVDLRIFRPNNPEVKIMRLAEREPQQSYLPRYSFSQYQWANDTIIEILKVVHSPADTTCIAGNGRYKEGYQFPDCTKADSAKMYFSISSKYLINQLAKEELPSFQ